MENGKHRAECRQLEAKVLGLKISRKTNYRRVFIYNGPTHMNHLNLGQIGYLLSIHKVWGHCTKMIIRPPVILSNVFRLQAILASSGEFPRFSNEIKRFKSGLKTMEKNAKILRHLCSFACIGRDGSRLLPAIEEHCQKCPCRRGLHAAGEEYSFVCYWFIFIVIIIDETRAC